jgi:hypothetical protein
MVSSGGAVAGCGEECDVRYSSDIDNCRLQYGDDPSDADDLANCDRSRHGGDEVSEAFG